MVVDVATDDVSFTHGTPRQLFEGSFLGGPGGESGYPDYNVTGDGQRFVMFPDAGQSTQTGHVTLVTNWFDELKRLVPTDP